eukprot:11564158-Prorocentrum_lima.AAC.1
MAPFAVGPSLRLFLVIFARRSLVSAIWIVKPAATRPRLRHSARRVFGLVSLPGEGKTALLVAVSGVLDNAELEAETPEHGLPLNSATAAFACVRTSDGYVDSTAASEYLLPAR